MHNTSQVFSFFHIVVRAKALAKQQHPITKGRLYNLMCHFCALQKSELLAFRASGNDVHLIVRLGGGIALGDFLMLLTQWSSYWITGLRIDEGLFWERGFWLKTLSPEDKQMAIRQIKDETLGACHGLTNFYNDFDQKTSQENCHHIIFTTARCRLIMPMKFRLQLYDAISVICSELGAPMVASASTRNHIHLLCYVPFFSSVTAFYYELRSRLTRWMHSNIHFRCVDELSAQFLAFTISQQRLSNEEYIVSHQDEIHYRKLNMAQPKCEEYLLYERLDHFTNFVLK